MQISVGINTDVIANNLLFDNFWACYVLKMSNII